MQVYILMHSRAYEGAVVLGVFSDKTKALDAGNKYPIRDKISPAHWNRVFKDWGISKENEEPVQISKFELVWILTKELDVYVETK